MFDSPKLPGFPVGSADKESACDVGNMDSILGLRRFLGGENGIPFQLFLPEKSHGHWHLPGRKLREPRTGMDPEGNHLEGA